MAALFPVFNPNDYLNFFPYGTIAVSASATSAHAEFTTTNSINAGGVMIINATSATVFVNFGVNASGTVTATAATSTESASSTPVPAGAVMVLTKGAGNDSCAVICPSSTGNVYFTAGVGV